MYRGGKKVNKSEEEDYYIPKRDCVSYKNNFIEHKSNGGSNPNWWLKEYFGKIKP